MVRRYRSDAVAVSGSSGGGKTYSTYGMLTGVAKNLIEQNPKSLPLIFDTGNPAIIYSLKNKKQTKATLTYTDPLTDNKKWVTIRHKKNKGVKEIRYE